MSKIKASLLSLLLVVACAVSSAIAADVRHEIQFPDLPGYKTLACDFHMHTVFSDGQVWPTVRVAEAWRQGLHAIAITDHIEYRPHKEDVVVKLNRPYELAAGAARSRGLLFVKGAEITRDTPPGHFNALFLQDIEPLDTKEFLDAIREANQQGAFVFWNHQGWQGVDKGRWLDVHHQMLNNKWLHGMEVCNGDEYYPEAHKSCLEKGLTMLGNSDIHEPDLRRKSEPDNHRTLTLVFVKEPTPAGLKEALAAGRTLVWYKDQLIGKEDLLRAMFQACVRVGKPLARSKTSATVEVQNVGNADVRLNRQGAGTATAIVLPARTTSLLNLPMRDPQQPIEAQYTASNFLVAPGTGLPVTLRAAAP